MVILHTGDKHVVLASFENMETAKAALSKY